MITFQKFIQESKINEESPIYGDVKNAFQLLNRIFGYKNVNDNVTVKRIYRYIGKGYDGTTMNIQYISGPNKGKYVKSMEEFVEFLKDIDKDGKNNSYYKNKGDKYIPEPYNDFGGTTNDFSFTFKNYYVKLTYFTPGVGF